MKNILRLFCIAFFVATVGVMNQYNVVKASDKTQILKEQSDGLSTAPNNLGLGSGLSSSDSSNQLFVAGNLNGYTTTSTSSIKNWALLMDSKGSTFSNKMRAIRMTFSKNQAGAMWSNVDQGNYMDITKKQTLSMWLYFGPSQHLSSGDGFGDGMAFVMQNPSNGITAFAHKNNALVVGESLGVWGADNDSNVSSAQDIANTAIPNSWALEFDTYNNTSTSPGSSSSFDLGYPDQHIGYGYPGDAATYKKNGTGNIIGGNYYYSQNLSGVEHVTLHDGNWHHLTISWNPVTFCATYSFNDKNPDGSKGSNPITRTTAPIYKSYFGDLTSNKLQWGFTSTTGANYEANLVAFESIPSSVEASNSSTITDITQNKEFDSNGTVNSSDKLAINYKLLYSSGKDPWKNINVKLNLPANVTYKPDASGNIGYIKYSDGSTPEAIPATEVQGATLSHALGKALDDPSRSNINSATISINGTANAVTSDTPVASVRAEVDSDNLLTDIDTPAFTIKKAKPINLTLDQSNISVDPNTDANITGTVSYNDGSAITNSQMSVYSTLNGDKFSDFSMSDSDAAGHLKLTIPSDKLKQDDNTLEIYVADPNGNRTTTSKVIITKKGSLSLTVDKAYEFGDINNSSASRLISRKGNWDISVNDGREVSPTNTWELSADTTGLTNNTGKFNGDMVFRNSNGMESTLTGDNLVDIANGVKTQTGQQTTNIASDWDSSDGIFLRSNGLTTAGAYDGTINWTLSDTL